MESMHEPAWSDAFQWRQELHRSCDNLDDTNLLREKVLRPLPRYHGRCKSGPKPRATATIDHLCQPVPERATGDATGPQGAGIRGMTLSTEKLSMREQ
jgi:hypothetical protein